MTFIFKKDSKGILLTFKMQTIEAKHADKGGETLVSEGMSGSLSQIKKLMISISMI